MTWYLPISSLPPPKYYLEKLQMFCTIKKSPRYKSKFLKLIYLGVIIHFTTKESPDFFGIANSPGAF